MPRPESTDLATDSEARPQVRPMPIAEFCDRLKIKYPYSRENKHETTLRYIRKITLFLTQHPSAKTTANLTPALIEEFVRTLSDWSDSGRIEALWYFRRFCNLAVEWGCLDRSPFDKYPIPKKQPRPDDVARKGRKLDSNQIRSLLTYLKARADTWKGRRFYTLTSIIIYT
jgi:hypothetical protein